MTASRLICCDRESLQRIISPDVKITDADLREYYGKHLDEFQG